MTAVVIGSYCSDFEIVRPSGSDNFCFYKATSAANGKTYYLASNVATTSSTAPTGEQVDDVKIIPESFAKPSALAVITVPASGSVPDENTFKQFKFKPFYPTSGISPDFSTTIIPSDKRRFLATLDHSAFITTDDRRFVTLKTVGNNTGGFKFEGTAASSATAFRPATGSTSTTTDISDANLLALEFSATSISPKITTYSTKPVYMVLKSDWEKRTDSTNKTKQLRYLVWDGTNLNLIDLYDPDISEATIKSSAYVVQNQTNIILNGTSLSDAPSITDTTTISTYSEVSTWGIQAYRQTSGTLLTPALLSTAPFTNIQTVTVVTTTGYTTSSPGTGVTGTDISQKLFGAGGVSSSSFYNSAGTAYKQSTLNGDSPIFATEGMETASITFTFSGNNSENYLDFTDGILAGGKTRTVSLEIMFTTQVFDKRVEELFTNVNVTLLRLVQPSSGTPAASPVAGTLNNYLGLEHFSPTNTIAAPTVALASGVLTCSTDGLIIRDYFKFRDPARATQFKFFDLGNKSEYIWQARWRSGAAYTFAYVSVNASSRIEYLEKISSVNQRGWILEYDESFTPPAVRLKWAPTGVYVDLTTATSATTTTATTGTDAVPMRIDGLTLVATQSAAAIFNCITCSSIDASGACIPIITNPFLGGYGTGARSSEIPITIRDVSVVSTIAGSAGTFGTADGTGAAATFGYPYGLAIDSTGTNLYVADSATHTIRKIVISTGVVSTIAGSAGSFGTADGTGAAARFYGPKGLAIDSAGTNLYVSDRMNNTIRKIVISTGVVSTIAGTATAGSFGTADGTGAAARFKYPDGLAIDSAGTNLYVADSTNHTIRKIIISSGVVSTIAGTAGSTGATDGTGAAARFNYPDGLAINSTGTILYVTDSTNHTIRKIVISTGEVSTLAGTAGSSGTADGTGAAARFNNPYGLAINSAGTILYVADSTNHTIRKIVISTGEVSTIAGTAGSSGTADGTGAAARFNGPKGLAIDSLRATLYASDFSSHTIRKITMPN